jgi:pimeloyl-ACP methyl ester carboxylesterase
MNAGRAHASEVRTIVFSHANSFPAGTYRLLFEAWRAAGFTVHAIEKYGHHAEYPVTNNWPHLRRQLVDFIEREVQTPAYLVGHSLGGFLSMMAASKQPELAAGVVVLDSPIISGLIARGLAVAKSTGFAGRVSPGKVSKSRRHRWPSPEAAHEHFSSKPMFARWDPRVLKDYIDAGIVPVPKSRQGHGLAFLREVETDIYNTIPHHLARKLREHPLQCPMAFIGGTKSVEVKRVGLRATERFTEGRISWLEGTHLYPFEKPEETAAEVLRWLQTFEQTPTRA